MKVRFLGMDKNSEWSRDFSVGREYLILGIEADHFRIVNDRGKPYLYPPGIFEISDRSEPSSWVSEYGEDGERYAYPPLLNRPGFFESYFDRDAETVEIFDRYLSSVESS